MSIVAILRSAITIMTPMLLAAAGGLFPALAGMLNIALEGLMLTGAFTAFAVYYFTGSVAASVLSAVLASAALSAILGFVSINLRSNIFIAGLAINLFSGGLCAVLSESIFKTRGVIAAANNFRLKAAAPFLSGVPVIGGIFSGQSFFVYASWLLLFVCYLVIYKTVFGYRLRACEESSEALNCLGISSDIFRFAALIICGLFCGMGGAFLSLNLGAYIPGIISGRGWIALVIIFLGKKKPAGLFAAAFVFGLADALSNHLQGVWKIPADFILAFPYICTLIAMIAISIKAKRP
jgi:simple sugar transport system permease protein